MGNSASESVNRSQDQQTSHEVRPSDQSEYQQTDPNQTDPNTNKPSGWPDMMTKYIGIIPQPVYLALLVTLTAYVLNGKVYSLVQDIVTDQTQQIVEISLTFAFIVLCSSTLGEIGKRLPTLNDMGVVPIITLLLPSFLVQLGGNSTGG